MRLLVLLLTWLSTLLHCRAEAQRSAKQLVQLEKEREKYSLEASEANARYMQVRHGNVCRHRLHTPTVSAVLRRGCHTASPIYCTVHNVQQ